MVVDVGVCVVLSNYHRRLRIISEALELRVEGGRVSHCWCMCIVSHGYGGLGGGKDEGGGWYACGIKPWGWTNVGRCRSISRVRGDKLMKTDHTAVQVRSSGLIRAGLGRSSCKGHNMGRHEKDPDRCPYSRLSTLHGVPRTR